MINSDDFDRPRIAFLPKWGFSLNAKPILKCEFGWNEQATEAFLSNTFQDLHLRVLPHQCMNIPPLGKKALEIKCIYLSGSGNIAGLEQFEELELISIDTYPKNGIKFQEFTKLKHISTTWDKKQTKDIFICQNLRGVDITAGFSEEDCRLFGNLPELRYLGFTQGRIKNINGLEKCIYLESIGLAYARNFVDLGDLTKFKNLSVLSLVNLPKLRWVSFPRKIVCHR